MRVRFNDKNADSTAEKNADKKSKTIKTKNRHALSESKKNTP